MAQTMGACTVGVVMRETIVVADASGAYLETTVEISARFTFAIEGAWMVTPSHICVCPKCRGTSQPKQDLPLWSGEMIVSKHGSQVYIRFSKDSHFRRADGVGPIRLDIKQTGL